MGRGTGRSAASSSGQLADSFFTDGFRRVQRTPAKGARGAMTRGKLVPTKTPPVPNYEPVQQEGKIPPWASLPYSMLKTIFTFASDSANPQWLVKVACMCRAFAEPAIAALYETPPLNTLPRAHGLARLVSSNKASRYNYQNKIKHLALDVGLVVAPSWGGQHLDVGGLLRNLPSLLSVELYHNKDESPYRQLHENIRWAYPEAIFSALGVHGEADGTELALRRLKSWHWSSRMLGKYMTLNHISFIHQSRPFQHLRRVHFVNFQLSWALRDGKLREDPEMDARDQQFTEDLAVCISALPSLEHLVLEASTVVTGSLLPMLPRCLKKLEIISCWEISSEDLTSFLLSHGTNLHVLKLLYNPDLSLGFLTILAPSCPNLRQLAIDLNYYRLPGASLSSDPSFYESLLTVDEVPQWPSSLEVIDIDNMHRWERPAASMFFNSLVDSAPNLPMLRKLSISARLTVPWRERSALRDLWVDKLRRIYLRPQGNPKPYSSLKDFRPDSNLPITGLEMLLKEKPNKTPKRCRSRRLVDPDSSQHETRRASKPCYKDPDTEDSEFESEYDSTRKKRRLNNRSGSSDDSELSELSEISDIDTTAMDIPGHEGTKHFIQGKCEIVNIIIDNQKPVENKFDMDDFLDETSGSESEWDGHDPDEAGGYGW